VVTAVATGWGDKWIDMIAKGVASGSASLLTLWPYRQRLAWQSRLRFCENFRILGTNPESMSKEIRLRMAENFWHEYDRWLKDLHDIAG
jgi:hypothetical protein